MTVVGFEPLQGAARRLYRSKRGLRALDVQLYDSYKVSPKKTKKPAQLRRASVGRGGTPSSATCCPLFILGER